MGRYSGIFTGHPAVTVRQLPSEPVVMHNRRGTVDQIRRSRQTAVTVGAVGVILILVVLLRLWMREKLDPPDVGNAVLVLVALALAVGYWYFVGRGQEEIGSSGSHLLVRGSPASQNGNTWVELVELARIDYLYVIEDSASPPGKYRVQIVDLDGLGQLTRSGSLSGIPTQDEATALAAAIAAQFGLRHVPGIFCNPVSTSRTDPLQFVPMREAAPQGKVHVTGAEGYMVVEYHRNPHWSEKAGSVVSAVTWPLVTFMVTREALTTQDAAGRIFLFLFMIPFWVAGIAILVSLFMRTQFQSEGSQLVRQKRILKYRFGNAQIALSNIEHVGTMVAWDSDDNMYFRVAAQMRSGEDIILIRRLPWADGHALVQALNQHLGLPIK